MDDFIGLAFSSMVIIMPAFIANSVPVLARGKRPVDLGRYMGDGRRVLGDGKTFEGFFAGLGVGTLSGALFGYPLHSFLLSLGALFGDMLGAFIKRRIGIERGKPAPILDQLDFVAGAILFLYPIYRVTPEQVLFIVIATPPIHLLTNYVAYRLGLKRYPW
ncbi:MAG: CDP-2,3-bis-(O-geranylgeranyl)-sn-glycerol synthase [Candidatus Verstraetearchaeota archaeon]|nr:CDP-2,3-bis-(O-geranylgeranyl)-sn-glycerol synthase [Candidatus Verstraetearchaeota archaeon]